MDDWVQPTATYKKVRLIESSRERVRYNHSARASPKFVERCVTVNCCV